MSLVKIFLSIIVVILLTKCDVKNNDYDKQDPRIWRITDLSELDSDNWSVALVDSHYNHWINGIQGIAYKAYSRQSKRNYRILVFNLPEKKQLMISYLSDYSQK